MTRQNVSNDYAALIDPAVLASLRSRIRGDVIPREDSRYESARRVWNGMIDRRPALIVRCRGAADVIASVDLARERGLPLSVRGGGHNVAGSAICDGMVLDLSLMNDVRVDPQRRTVRAGAGALLGDVNHETSAFGLAVPMGVMSRTGIAGLTLHGGVGLLMRRYGLTCDNLLAADVVTADGRLLLVDENSHSDLFWALRGGGGSFGVVTSFEFRAYPVEPETWLAMVFYDPGSAVEVMRGFRAFMESAGDEVVGLATFWTAGHEEMVPAAHRGAPVLAVVACHAGSVDRAERALAPLRHLATPLFDLSGSMPFLAAQTLFDAEYPDGRRYYWKSTYLSRLDDEVAAALAAHAARRPSPLTSIDLVTLGGAVARVKPEDTAYARRGEPYLLAIEANWDDPSADQANVAWAREAWADVRRFSGGGAYLNFAGFGEEGDMLLREAYAGNYERLEAIKKQYDPDNLFRHAVGARDA